MDIITGAGYSKHSKYTADSILPHSSVVVPPKAPSPPTGSTLSRSFQRLVILVFVLSASVLTFRKLPVRKPAPFFSSVTTPSGLCVGSDGHGVSHAGFIGLNGDSDQNPKRSFFWFFEALQESGTAPVILTLGGGPGSSGLLNPLFGQSHCLIGPNGTTPSNPDPWTQRFNLLALDHPIGVGFSYGTAVDNSRSAALDAYDFLQKWYRLYPHLVKHICSHIATVIHEQNQAISRGRGQPGAVHINLESLILSNPYSKLIDLHYKDAQSHFRWVLQQRCYNTNLYNSTTCTELFQILPSCLEKIQFAYESHSTADRVDAFDTCVLLLTGDPHGTQVNDVRKKCEDLEECYPQFTWAMQLFNNSTTRRELGIPDGVEYIPISEDVFNAFLTTGDWIQPAYLMYEPLMKDGIRVLHYVGAQDANVGWPGVLSYLKLLRTPFQEAFLKTPDVPWNNNQTTVRVVGEGAGDMTYILVLEAGHFVEGDQPKLVKDIVEHWIDNRGFT